MDKLYKDIIVDQEKEIESLKKSNVRLSLAFLIVFILCILLIIYYGF